MPFDYGLSDMADAKSIMNAQMDNQRTEKPLRTSASTVDNPQQSLTSYGLSDAMQGIALYKPPGTSYDAFNNHLSAELEGLGTEAKWKDRDNKLRPYDVFIKDPVAGTEGAVALGNAAGTATSSATAPGVVTTNGSSTKASGTIQELCQKIVSHPNITFDPGRVRGQFEALSSGQPVQMGGGPGISANLLGIIVGIADRFPIQISSFIRPEAGPKGHGAGRAVDIDGTDRSLGINGSDARSNKIVEAAISMIPDDGSFKLGFGRGNRTTPLSSIPGGGTKGTYDFADNANHVHIQIDE